MAEKEAVQFVVWNINGGVVPNEAVVKIERIIEKTIKEFDEHENVRLLTQTVRG